MTSGATCPRRRRGLIRPSFVPPPRVRRLRDLTRYRTNLVSARIEEELRPLQPAVIRLSSSPGISKVLLETIRDISGCYHQEVLDALWAQVPDRFRTLELHSVDLSPEDLAAFSLKQGTKSFRLRFCLLPAPLDRELAWCCRRMVELGGLVPVSAVGSLIRWLASTVEDHPGFRGSLMGHTPREWERTLAVTYARRNGRLPGKNWVLNTTSLLRRCYRMLSAAYDDRP